MQLNRLSYLAEHGIPATADYEYLRQLTREMKVSGILVKGEQLDEGILDIARNIKTIVKNTFSGGVKDGAQTFMRYLFSGTNAKKMGKGIETAINHVVSELNRKAKSLAANKRTAQTLLTMATNDLKTLIGPTGLKIFTLSVSNNKDAVSLIENPRLVPNVTEPLIKISLAFDVSGPPPAGTSEFFTVTYSQKLDKRAFELQNLFNDSSKQRPTHGPEETPHGSSSGSSSGTASSGSTGGTSSGSTGGTSSGTSGTASSGTSDGNRPSGASTSSTSAPSSASSGSRSPSPAAPKKFNYSEAKKALSDAISVLETNGWKLNATEHNKILARITALKKATTTAP